MKTLLGAIAGALTLGAVLVAYDLGERHMFSQDMLPTTQMVIGPDGVARPYLVQTGMTQPYGWSPYAATVAPGAVAPYAVSSAQPQYASERAVYSQPTVRRAPSYTSERAEPKRSWQKSALLIGGSAGAGAGVGALIGGKKGAGIGALIGGGSAAIYDQVKRH